MKKELSDYHNPFEANEEFEKALAEYTGAKGVIVVDSCTHAIELGLRYSPPKMYATIPEQAHFSTAMTLKMLGIEYMFTDDEWEKEYRIHGSTVYDAAQFFEKDMFEAEPGKSKIQCISFGPGSPMDLGGGGAILTNNKVAYEWLKNAASHGRDLSISHENDQKEFTLGYRYYMRPADAVLGLHKLAENEVTDLSDNRYTNYSNLREVEINT